MSCKQDQADISDVKTKNSLPCICIADMKSAFEELEQFQPSEEIPGGDRDIENTGWELPFLQG